MKQIVPSLLSADFADLAGQVALVEEAGAERLHFDVMDGHFVPNLTFGAPVLAAVRSVTPLHFEAHLMVTNPEKLVDDFANAGADTIIVHAEATDHLHRLIQKIKSLEVKAGVSVNPATSVSVVEEVLGELDLLLIMTVNPGYGGQTMIKPALSKLNKAREMVENSTLLLEVDGGVNLKTVKEVADAGADLLVSGSALFGADDVPVRFREMMDKANPKG